MAQPKKLTSPYSASPEKLPNRIPAQEDFSDIAEDFSDIAEPVQPQRKGQLEIPSEFGSMAEAEAAAQAFVPSRETVADIGASLATQVPTRLAAGVAGTAAGGPLAGYLAQQTAGATAAYFEKDVANIFRKALGAPENEERDRATDVALSFLSDIPGAAIVAGKSLETLAKVGGKTAIESGKKIVESLPVELQSFLGTLKSSIQDAMGQYIPAEEAANQVANLEKDFVSLMKNGYSPQQAGKSVIEKYSFQVRANQAKADLIESVGSEIKDFGKIASMPQNIIEVKQARVGRLLDAAFEAVKQTKGLDQVDLSVMVKELRETLGQANSIGDKELSKNIENVIDAITERQKLKTEYNDLSAFNKATGGKPPSLIDVETGVRYQAGEQHIQDPLAVSAKESTFEAITQKNLPTSGRQSPLPFGRTGTQQSRDTGPFIFETQKIDRPGVSLGKKEITEIPSEQMGLPMKKQVEMTPEEQASRMLPPKVSDQNQNVVMQSIRSLIEKRRLLDARIPLIKNEEKKLAMQEVVSGLRDIEDRFMLNLRNKGGKYAEIADKYISAKQSFHSVKSAVESMGDLVRQDAVGVSQMLNSSKPEEIAAWAALMPKEAKESVARRYVEGILDVRAGMPDRPYTPEDFLKIEKALSDKYQQKKLGILIGPQKAQEVVSDIRNLSRLIKAAQTLPASAGPERQIVRKLFASLERLSKDKGLNFIYSGRMAFAPETRAYRDFLSYVMSKDFAGAVASVSDPAEIAVAGAELTRVFGSNHPTTKRFYNFIQNSNLLPYAAVPAVRAGASSIYRGREPGQQ